MTSTDIDKRAAYTAGLRALADLLDEHPDVPLPQIGQSPSEGLDWWFFTEDPKADMARVVRLIPGAKTKEVGEHGDTSWMTVRAALHGLHLDLNARRDAVCTRVVKSVREITEEVPDPDALAAVPTVTVTRTVEDVEWDCGPILAGATS